MKLSIGVAVAIAMMIAGIEAVAQTPLISSSTVPSPTMEITDLYPGDRVEIDYRPMVYEGSGLKIGSATWDVSRAIGFNRVHPFHLRAETTEAVITDEINPNVILRRPYQPGDLLTAYGTGNVIHAATGYLVERPTPIFTPTPGPVFGGIDVEDASWERFGFVVTFPDGTEIEVKMRKPEED